MHVRFCAVCDVVNIFIGIPYGMDDQSLRESFSSHGEVVEGMWIVKFSRLVMISDSDS